MWVSQFASVASEQLAETTPPTHPAHSMLAMDEIRKSLQ
jgi:hypothetical protein